jgi:GT2 family glycosyltransferase
MPEPAILIVAYRSAEKLRTCLRAIEEHLPTCNVYVWDNSGPSYCGVRTLAEESRQVRWFLNSDNIGFAAAVNKLAELVSGQDMLLVNPDAELLGALPLTLRALREPRVAAAAPLVECQGPAHRASLLSEEPMPWDVAHRPISLVNAFFAVAFPPQRFRGTRLSDLYRRQPTNVTGYLTGACLAIGREAWDEIGPLDEEFFLYGEEADWQRRARGAGWTLRLAAETGVRHAAHGTVSGDSTASDRSNDLLRAGVALQLEYRYGKFVTDCFIALVSLTELIKRRVFRPGDSVMPADVVITVGESECSSSMSEKVSVATALTQAGHRVTLVSLGRLGGLPRVVPAAIRLIRRPWWWPTTAPYPTPGKLVRGGAKRERAFARLYRLRRGRICFSPGEALGSLVRAEGTTRSGPRQERC